MNVHKQVRQLKDMLYLQSHHCILVGTYARSVKFLVPTQTPKIPFCTPNDFRYLYIIKNIQYAEASYFIYY